MPTMAMGMMGSADGVLVEDLLVACVPPGWGLGLVENMMEQSLVARGEKR